MAFVKWLGQAMMVFAAVGAVVAIFVLAAEGASALGGGLAVIALMLGLGYLMRERQ